MKPQQEVYLIEVDGKISQEGYDKLEDAQKYMAYKAKVMNTYDKLEPQIGLTGATYFRDTGNRGFNDPFKEGIIRILFIRIKKGEN